MRKILLILLTVFTGNLYCQLDYGLTYSNATYTELTSGTDVSTAAWSGTHLMTMPFQFTYFGKAYSKIQMTYNGVFFSDSGDDYISYSSDNLIPEDGDYAKSPISYEVTGMSPNRILKVQYKNIRDEDIDTSSYEYILNVQIWLHENGNKFEYHFGNTSITDPGYDKNIIGFKDFDNSPYLAIDSSAAKPVLVRVFSAGSFEGIASYPVSGQVYTLTPSNSSTLDKVLKPYVFNVNNKGFEITSPGSFEVDVIDICGKGLGIETVQGNQYTSYDLSGFSAGIYLLQIRIGNNTFTEKLILQ